LEKTKQKKRVTMYMGDEYEQLEQMFTDCEGKFSRSKIMLLGFRLIFALYEKNGKEVLLKNESELLHDL